MNPSALVVLKTITSVWSIGLYLSPAPTVYRIYKTKATGETQLIPFVTMICNYYLWAMYSLFIDDLFPLLCTAMFGELMGIIYTAVFARYTSDKKRVLKTVCFAAIPISVITVFALLVCTGAIHQSNATTGLVLGYIEATTTCLFFASPLIKVRTVLRTKSAACIITPLCVMGGIHTAIWMAYALAVSDMFLLVPNVIAFILNALQIFLAIKYRPSSSKDITTNSAVQFHSLQSPV